jgi:diadenosine tetraphosphatase ApaH/serine/threonine PP2A family protein phosphatase
LLLALLSDIHANLEALNACLSHARAQGATRHAFLGDLVGYGADPGAVIEIVRRHAAEGAVVVQGNHDAAVARSSGVSSESALDAIRWTRSVLGAEAIAWLSSLPLQVREERICFVHASDAAPQRWEYVDNANAARKSADAAGVPWTFCGHVHKQTLFFEGARGRMTSFTPVPGVSIPMRRGRRWVAIAGSVGQPRERNPAAAYALFDPGRERITFYRVSYDHLAPARKVREAGLPDLFRWSAWP